MKGTGHVAIHLSRYKGIEKVVRLKKEIKHQLEIKTNNFLTKYM